MPRIYLDHNATSPLRPEAREAMRPAMDVWGNPSSIHAEGRKARAIVEQARDTVARSTGAPAENVIFTSGGTEAANAAIFAASRAGMTSGSVRTVFVLATEHSCVLRGVGGTPAETIPVNSAGIVRLDRLRDRLERAGPAVIAIQDANNETGVGQPVAEVCEVAREFNALVVCDAVQTAGRTGVSSDALEADMVFLSAHKFGGPKGTGAIVVKRDGVAFEPLLRGGGQQRGRRGGTENVIGIAGMAAALEAGDRDREQFRLRTSTMQHAFEARLRSIAPETVIFGETAPRVPHTTCFAVHGLSAETLLMAFDLDGVAVSSGSACSSGKVAPSHVLGAMGVAPDLARCAIRVSTGWNSTDGDIDRFLDVWKAIYTRLRPRAAA